MLPVCSEHICNQMSLNKNHITSVIFSNQDTTSAFMVCKKKTNLIAITVEGHTDGDILKDGYIKESKVASLLFFIRNAATIYLYSDRNKLLLYLFILLS